MFAYIEGKIEEKDPTFVVLDVGGVGYEINISLYTYAQIKDRDNCRLYTYFHVKEDIQALYGFADHEEKLIFKNLISVSGIGPNTGMVMLSSMTPAEVYDAVTNANVAAIQKVKGIGGKTAQRVILELKDKLAKVIGGDSAAKLPAMKSNSVKSEALSALTTLGIPRSTAEKNIEKVYAQHGEDISLEQLIKLALKSA